MSDVLAYPQLQRYNTKLNNKFQTKLTFDNVPTQNSSNPVKSGGVYSVFNALGLSVVDGKLCITYTE